MNFESPATILDRAKIAWEKNATGNRRVVLLYALPALSLPLVVLAINLLLDQQLAGTGGLSGISLRSTLETIQMVLSNALRLLLPFWQLGLIYCAMGISRGQDASTDRLFAGFRHWGAVLRLMLFRTFRYTFSCLGGLFLGSAIYTMTPLSNKLLAASEIIANDPAYVNITAEELLVAVIDLTGFQAILPYYILCILGIAFLTIPLVYRYRMSNYVLLDSENPRALQCIHKSTRMMRGNAIALFKIDLRFWWYYLLMVLATAVSYGDLLLPLFGIALPFSAQWSLVIFALLSTAMQLAIYYLFTGPVETAYACVYNALNTSEGGNTSL